MLTVNEHRMKTIDVLVSKSHTDYIDLLRDIPWDAYCSERPVKRDSSSWIYGTGSWEALSPAQRLELQQHELARDVSMFIHLEETLPVLYQGYVNRFGPQLAPAIRDYLSLFSKEELVHILMFRRYLACVGQTIFPAPEGYKELFLDKLPGMHPVYGIAATLVTEIIAEDGAMFATQDDAIDVLTRTMFFRHHREELRHIAFGKLVVAAYLDGASQTDAGALRRFIASVTSKVVRNYLFNPDILDRLGFALPGLTDIHDEIRMSPHNRASNPARFPTLIQWCGELGLRPAEIAPYFA